MLARVHNILYIHSSLATFKKASYKFSIMLAEGRNIEREDTAALLLSNCKNILKQFNLFS